MIKKWDEQIALHRRVVDDPLMYTWEERLKNSHYAQAICAVLADLKQVKNLSSNTVLADSFSREDMKNFAEWCRNGLLNTEYNYEKRDELLERWQKNFR